MTKCASAKYSAYISSLLICLLISASPVFADDIIVDPNENYGDYTTIQAAINNAGTGDVIIVNPATYIENIDMLSKAITLRSTNPTDPNIVVATIIDGGAAGSVIICNNTSSNTVINGFTITNGGNCSDGAGIYCETASPKFSNCIITANSSSTRGGGMYLYNANPTITNCVITANTGGPNGYGSGIYCSYASNTTIINSTISNNIGEGLRITHYSQASVANCKLSSNSGSSGGGAITLSTGSDLWMNNSTLTDNSSSFRGGAIYITGDCYAMVANSLINYNTASSYGGAIACYDSTLDITGCTLGYNYGSNRSLYCNLADITIANSILWAQSTGQIYTQSGDPPTINYSCVIGGYTGDGNISTDPLFTDPDGPDNIEGTEDDNFRLQSTSPCIDAGANQYLALDLFDLNSNGITTEISPYDLDGNPRTADVTTVTDSGVQYFPAPPVRIVDMGTYERPGVSIILGDLDYDGDVELVDLAIFAQNWLTGT